MRRGQLAVHGTLFGLLCYGLSREHLFFRWWAKHPKTGHAKRHEVRLIDSGGIRPAYRCEACGATFAPGRAN
jgi:hypothetical protein